MPRAPKAPGHAEREPWAGSTRRSRLPKDWPKRRASVLARDGDACTWRMPDGTLCTTPATDVDHVVPGDDHSDGNLRSLCRDHHQRKSSHEGLNARWAVRQKREPERHPGLK